MKVAVAYTSLVGLAALGSAQAFVAIPLSRARSGGAKGPARVAVSSYKTPLLGMSPAR